MNVRRLIHLSGWLLVVTGAPCAAGELELADGKVLVGDVAITADGSFTVASPGQAARTIPLNDVVRAIVSPVTASALGTEGAALTWPWRSSDVGTSRVAGTVNDEHGAFTVSAAGWGAWSGVDSFHFVHQLLDGDGQILARVTLPKTGGSRAIGAVMIRASLEPASPFVAAALGPNGPARLQARPLPQRKQPTAEAQAGIVMDPSTVGWVRVTRQGDLFIAYRSTDGSSWEEVGRQTIKMPTTAFVGLATSSNVNMPTGPVRFDNVSVLPGSPATTAAASALPAKGVVLADGTAMPGEVTAIGADAIQFKATDATAARSLPIEDVAWVLLQPTFPSLSTRGAGVLLRSGDFFDGESITLTDGKVNVVSTVFGPKTLDATTEAVAIVLREPEQWTASWHVRDKAGRVVSGPDMKVENGHLVTGKHSIALTDVRELFRPDPAP